MTSNGGLKKQQKANNHNWMLKLETRVLDRWKKGYPLKSRFIVW
jgi:hypothetical protein